MSSKQPDETAVKRMANLLRQGATLTELACPVCASPLFRLKNGDLWCAKDEKKVIVVKEGEEPTIKSNTVLDTVEATLLAKVQEIQKKIENEHDTKELQKLGKTLSDLLENLEKTRKAKKA